MQGVAVHTSLAVSLLGDVILQVASRPVVGTVAPLPTQHDVLPALVLPGATVVLGPAAGAGVGVLVLVAAAGAGVGVAVAPAVVVDD